ncbi:MAG: hypothetical protein WBX15_02305 [Thermoanaerobaculia bacterium]
MERRDHAEEPGLTTIQRLGREELEELVRDRIAKLTESEAIAVLRNPYSNRAVCELIAGARALTSFYSVQLQLVRHRHTPPPHSLRFVPHLYWSDLVRLSIDVRIPPMVRRAMDEQLLVRLQKMTSGEKISIGRLCSQTILNVLLFEQDRRIFASVLINPRLVEADLVRLINSGKASVDQLTMIGENAKWSSRNEIRRALVLNPRTPKAVAASQLRRMPISLLRDLSRDRRLSLYLRRCIENLQSHPAKRSATGL